MWHKLQYDNSTEVLGLLKGFRVGRLNIALLVKSIDEL